MTGRGQDVCFRAVTLVVSASAKLHQLYIDTFGLTVPM